MNIREEVKTIAEKIKNNKFVTLGSAVPNYIDEDIIDFSDKNNQHQIINYMNNIMGRRIQRDDEVNILEISKNISEEDLEEYFNRISFEAEEQEDNQRKLIFNLDEFNLVFDNEIEKALKESIFEYKLIHIFLIDKDKNEYLREKNNCNNKETKILFHGTKLENAINIFQEELRDANKHLIGIGKYFTDSLDYAWCYSGEKHFEKLIPKVGESFSLIASEVYYDHNLFELYNGFSVYKPVEKNGIRMAYNEIRNGRKLIKREIKDGICIVKEYLITEKSQILPLYYISIKRIEYLVIWRDYNFNSNNPNKYSEKIFNEMQEFHRKIKKIISRDFNSKVYYTKTMEEALDLIYKKNIIK